MLDFLCQLVKIALIQLLSSGCPANISIAFFSLKADKSNLSRWRDKLMGKYT